MKTLDQLQTPTRILFVVGNGLVWISFCATMVLHWGTMSVGSHWAGVALAASFLLLGRSLLKDDDRSSRMIYASSAFWSTIVIVSRALF